MVECKIEERNANAWIRPFMTKGVLDGSRAQDRFLTSCEFIEPEKRVILSQPVFEGGTLDEPDACPWMAFSVRSVMVYRCVWGVESDTDRR